MVTSRQGLPSWISAAAATRVDSEGNVENMIKDGHGDSTSQPQSQKSSKAVTDVDLSFGERAFSASGAAFLSAIIVNPLDVAKTRLQAQAAGVPYQTCFETNMFFPELKSSQSCARSVLGSEPVCPPECSRYKGTLDVFYKVIRQEGFARLWRGTNASLALAVPTVGIYMPCYDIFRNSIEEFTTNNAPTLTPYVPLVAGIVARSFACVTCYPVELARTRMQAFKETQSGVKPPGVWKTLVGVINPVMSTNYIQNLQSYRILWTGLSAQLARDVPFSAICWSTLEPIRRKLLVLMGDEAGVGSILGANFTAGFVAGSIAAAVTCPLDVAKTRSQIEKDPTKALKMTTRQTLLEIWRDGGMKGLFTGLGPRVGRAGPSVGIVVSFYEVVKYALHSRHEDFE
ncbi:Mitochondrial substrate carrier family protein [Theobroma cacao]|uniref:Mitochondrial substrate carrier family protein n=1 Tax=Theobroma cacao TaxID=3641 RepID=A0A061DTS3_THECC|nr:Mitochondrial substrate carrier family protein [Theobroma cacao]